MSRFRIAATAFAVFATLAVVQVSSAAQPHAVVSLAYLEVPGVNGNGGNDLPDDAIVLNSYAFSTQTTTNGPALSTIQVSKPLDATSPVFSDHYFKNQPFHGTSKITILQQGAAKTVVVAQIELANLSVVADTLGASTGSGASETLTFSYTAFQDCVSGGNPAKSGNCATLGNLPTPTPTPPPATPSPTPSPTASPTPTAPPSPHITEFGGLSTGAKPELINIGADGQMWFAESGIDKIAKVSSAGAVTEYPLALGSQPADVVPGPAGAFANQNFVTEPGTNKLADVSTTGSVAHDIATTGASGPFGAARDASHDVLWFTENASGAIGKISFGPALVETKIPTTSNPAPAPLMIALDPSTTLMYFTDANGYIGVFDPSNIAGLKEYQVLGGSPDVPPHPWGIAPWTQTGASTHLIWFTDWSLGSIDSFNPTTHNVTSYPLPQGTDDKYPQDIAVGPDNALWFVEKIGNNVGRFDPVTHTFTEYPIPTANARPYGIVKGPDGASMWFTECNGNKIGTIGPIQSAAAIRGSLKRAQSKGRTLP